MSHHEGWEYVLKGRSQAFGEIATELRTIGEEELAEYCNGRAKEAQTFLSWLQSDSVEEVFD